MPCNQYAMISCYLYLALCTDYGVIFSCTNVGTYIPSKEVVVEETIRATVIKPNQAIKLRARKETTVREIE